MKVEQLIESLGLQPHPEGGFYKETYRCKDTVPKSALPDRYAACRNASTAIFYLLTPETFSVMHKLKSDEVFHFYLGDPVEMLILLPDKSFQQVTLGQDIEGGQHLQLMVPHGWWQGCRVKAGGKFALLGCTVAPGFDFADYVEGRRDELVLAYPEARDLISQLTRK